MPRLASACYCQCPVIERSWARPAVGNGLELRMMDIGREHSAQQYFSTVNYHKGANGPMVMNVTKVMGRRNISERSIRSSSNISNRYEFNGEEISERSIWSRRNITYSMYIEKYARSRTSIGGEQFVHKCIAV